MAIYNIRQYLQSNLTSEKIFANVAHVLYPSQTVPDRRVIIREDPGAIEPVTGWTRLNLNVITRDKDAPKARQLAISVFNLLRDKYSLVLPAVTVDGVIYPAINISQISPNSPPSSLGLDANGLAEYTCNYRVLFTWR